VFVVGIWLLHVYRVKHEFYVKYMLLLITMIEVVLIPGRLVGSCVAKLQLQLNSDIMVINVCGLYWTML